MSNTKISNLTNAGALSGTEVIPIVQSGTTVKTTAQDIANLTPAVPPKIYIALVDWSSNGSTIMVNQSIVTNTFGASFTYSVPFSPFAQISNTNLDTTKAIIYWSPTKFYENATGTDVLIIPCLATRTATSFTMYYNNSVTGTPRNPLDYSTFDPFYIQIIQF